MRNFLVVAPLVLLCMVQYIESMDVICYVTSWSKYRSYPVQFTPSMTDPNKCDKVIYSFFTISSDDRLVNIESYDYEFVGQLTQLKSVNPNLKVMIAVGGATASQRFSSMVSRQSGRQTFIASVLSFMQQYNVDGIDIDWEYPLYNDKENFVTFMKELRGKLGPNYEISMATAAGISVVDAGYNIKELNKYVDFIGVMSYDYLVCLTSSRTVEHQAPLYPAFASSRKDLSVDSTMRHYIQLGASPEKLVLGLPFYGRVYGLSSDKADIGHNTANGYCPLGQYTQTGGIMAYYEVCPALHPAMERRFDQVAKVPYLTGSQRWFGYDDAQSLTEKIHYAKQNGFKGVMIWSIDFDDFNNALCKEGAYPLLTIVHNVAKEGGSGPNPTKPTTSTTKPIIPPPTTKPNGGGGGGSGVPCSCGKMYEPNYDTGCSSYYYCTAGTVAGNMKCPEGTQYSFQNERCDWPYNVDCINRCYA